MSRTIPDLHIRNSRSPQQRRVEKKQIPNEKRFSTRESCDTATGNQQASKVNRSGEVFVTQGENNRLMFKAATFHGPRSGQTSCGFQGKKDGTKVYLHLCWHFWKSDVHSKETKDLLIALDRVVRILKDLDCYHVEQSHGEDLHSEKNVCGSVKNFGSILSFGRMNVAAPEKPAQKTPARFESTRLQGALVENGDLPTPEKTRESNCEHHHSSSARNGKRKLQCESGNPTRTVFPKKKIPGSCARETHERQCPTGSQRKKNKCEAEATITYDPRLPGNRNKVREAMSLDQKLRMFLRDRERRARDSTLASARKVARESKSRYGEGKRPAGKTTKTTTEHDFRVDSDWKKTGKAAPDVERARQNIARSFHLYRQSQKRINPDDDADELNVAGSDTDSPPEGVTGYRSDSDTEIASPTSHRGKDADGHRSATKRNNFSSMGGPESRSARGNNVVKIGKRVNRNGKGRNKGSVPNKLASKLNQRKADIVSFSVPKVDEVFTGPNWKSLDGPERVRAILNQFHYLEEYFRSKNQNETEGQDGRHRLRPDLKAGHYLLSRGFCFNRGHSVVGAIPGVSIGQCFRYREELLLLTVHRAQQAGIDYIAANKSDYKDDKGNRVSVAVSIVASGGYKDNQDDGKTTLIYSGQGGYSNKTQCNKSRCSQDQDQELVRGNLALVNSFRLDIPVRVTRGIQANDQGRRLYVYDGLYDVKRCYEETGASGFRVWKFKLVKQAGQPVSSVSRYLSAEEVTSCLYSTTLIQKLVTSVSSEKLPAVLLRIHKWMHQPELGLQKDEILKE